MKKIVIYLTMFIAFILLIGEFEEITFSIISIKLLGGYSIWRNFWFLPYVAY